MKIGQMVKIVKKIDMTERPCWVSSMDQTVGHTETIQDIVDLTYKIINKKE